MIAILFAVLVLISAFIVSPYSVTILVTPSNESEVDFVFIANTDSGPCSQRALDQWNKGAIDGVLLWTDQRKRLVLLGAVSPIQELVHRKLVAEGVPADVIQILPGERRSNWETARALKEWLTNHQEQRVSVICDLFSSRRWSLILDQILDDTTRARVIVDRATDPRFDVSNWWRNRIGIKTYFYCLFELVYAQLHGEDMPREQDWAPEKYESSVFRDPF